MNLLDAVRFAVENGASLTDVIFGAVAAASAASSTSATSTHGASYFDNPEPRKSEVEKIHSEMVRRMEGLQNEFTSWSADCQSAADNFDNFFEKNIDAAFYSLVDLTTLLVTTSHDEHRESVDASKTADIIGALRLTKALFLAVVEVAKGGLEKLSIRSQDAFVEEAALYKLIQEFSKYEQDLEAECKAVSRTTAEFEKEWYQAVSDSQAAGWRLAEKERSLNNIIDDLFTNKNAILGPLRNDKNHQEQNRDRLQRRHDAIYQLYKTESQTLSDLKTRVGRLDVTMHTVQKVEHELIDSKENWTDVYSKLCTMEAYLESRGIQTDRLDCLRHILMLLKVQSEVVDNDRHVLQAKEEIYRHIGDNFTDEELRKLEETKKFLELDI